MSESRHRRIERLFEEVAALEGAARAAALERIGAEDPAARAELARLLDRDARGDPAALRPLVSFESESPPAELGPYRLGAKLGEGGFGEVWAAEQREPFHRRVAIKLLRPGVDTRAVLQRFEAERHALARMEHPGIARVLDAGATPAGRPYFVMERVEGESITAFADRHGLDVRARVRLMVGVCRAIEHAHQKGVIHRDLKPSNLLAAIEDGAPRARVIDFGIAKATAVEDGATLTTRFGETIGTPEYASPEQLESGGADVDTRTDVYSLGVVLYRLLAGRLPLDSESLRRAAPAEAARMLRERALPRPSEAAEGFAARELRGDLDWVILKALEPDRERRYASAAALAEDLERYLAGDPVSAGPPGAGYRLGKFARRHRAAVVGGAAVVLALVAGLAATIWQANRARRAAADAVAVNAFLTRMIGGANPEAESGGREATVREMVDRAARELDESGAGSDAVESSLRRAIGTTYMGLGRYEDADAQLAKAEALEERGGAESGERVATRLARAELESRRGRYALADSLLLALPRQAPSVTRDPAARLRWLRLRGGVLANLSRPAEADSLLGLALASARATGAGEATLAILGELASVRASLGKQEEAVAFAREAFDLVRAAGGEDRHAVAEQAGRLAEILHQGGDYAAAESLHREALRVDERVLGVSHPMVATRLSNLAWVLTDAGELEEAEAAHRRAVALHAATLGEDHPTLAIARGHLATVLQQRGKLEEARSLRLAALAVLRRRLGEDHEEVANAFNNLASCYRLMKRDTEAAAAFREAIPRFERLYGPVHPALAICRHNLGKTLGDAGRPAEAEAVLREAMDVARQVFPEGHVNLAFFGVTWGRTLATLGRHAQAESTLRASHAKILETLGPGHARTIEARDLLARYGGP